MMFAYLRKKVVVQGKAQGFGHGEFASSDIRYRNDSEASTSDDVSTVSEFLAKNSISDFDSEYELPGSNQASVPNFHDRSMKCATSMTGAGLLLQKLKNQRSSRLAAKLT